MEFVKRRNNWRADRVYVRADAGELVSLLLNCARNTLIRAQP